MTATLPETVAVQQKLRTDRRPVWALAGICVLAAVLYAWAIWAGQIGNSYYSAAVRSMSGSFTNFLFGSFDPYGVVTVDKPPMALWPQVISVWIFGYHGWSVLLPQVIAGVAAVFLLHRTVRRWAGEHTALLAALILALTPITVAINRDNNPDTLLVLLLVGAAYAVTRSFGADSTGSRTRWLLLGAFLIGCGFVTKMLQAWIIAPGVAAAYLAGTTGPLRRRLADLGVAGVVLLAASFWWAALYDLWPWSKPYIGGSEDGGALDLIFGYNGFGRVFGEGQGAHSARAQLLDAMRPEAGTLGSMFGGHPGPGRLFSAEVGGQISWLLPVALLALVVVATRIRGMPPQQRGGWVLWGGWLLVTGLVFSIAQGIWHEYYTTMLAPAVAAVTAAGLALLWREHRHTLLPVAIALGGTWAYVVSSRTPEWQGWTRWVVLALTVLSVLALLVHRWPRPAVALGLGALLITPAVWSALVAITHDASGGLPAAGPRAVALSRIALATRSGRPGELSDTQREVLSYAETHGGGADITLAVDGGALFAADFVINADSTVIGLGGFAGSDAAPSLDTLRGWISDGTLRFVLEPAVRPSEELVGAAQWQRSTWIAQHCAPVDPRAYGSGAARDTLYDCR